MLQTRAFGTDKIVRNFLHRQIRGRIEYAGTAPQAAGPLAHAVDPLLIQNTEGLRCFLLIHRWGLARKIRRVVSLLDLHLLVGFDLDQAARGQPVSTVGLEPNPAADRIRYVVERNHGARREARSLTLHNAIVVQLGAAHPDGDIQVANAILAFTVHCA